MKGCSSLKKVIDITLRKKENGTTGRWGLFGDTYGGAKRHRQRHEPAG